MRMALTGDFSQEKARVTDEMRLRLLALRTDKLLPPILKEVAIKIGVVSVFRYSAGLVPWSKTELDHISKSWVAAYKQAWTFSKTLDSSPMCFIGGHSRADFFKSLHESAKSASRELFADFCRLFLRIIYCNADFLQTFSADNLL